MAYDAEIRVGTKVDTSQMQKLQIQINKTTDKVARLTQEMRELKNTEIPTDEYKELQTELDKSEKYVDSLYKKLRVMEKAGTVNTAPYKKLKEQIKLVDAEIDRTRVSMQELFDTGKAFTLGTDTEEYAKKAKELSYAQAELQAFNTKQDELSSKQQKSAGNFSKMANSAKKAFAALSSGAKSTFEKVSSVAKKAFGLMNRDVKKTNGLLATMRSRMQGLALSLLVFNQVTKAFNAMVSGAKEGISEFAKYSKDCNAVLSDFKSSLQTMKYNLGAAFAPIVQTVLPYLTAFINTLNSVISKISQFFAVLTGGSSYYRAIQQQVDFAGSLEDTANAAKEAAGALAGFDKLNVVKQQDGSGSSGSGSGSGGFEEVPIDNNIKELAEKVKEILALLFAPLKEAWENEGQFVMESWQSALKEIWALVKDIGRDFLTVWGQKETVAIFEDILHILGDIGLIIANLTRNFREAWNENKNGLHILEGIRDIIGVVVKNIRNAADETVKWADGLNFSPLMGKTSEWIQSLIPAIDSLSGVLPDLLQVFIDFNHRVDWEGLRTRLAEFWKVLEPFAETVGDGVILFIGNLSQKIADFTKSETFEKMLNWLEEKMSGTTPEDIATGIERIATAIIFFKGVSLGLTALTAITPAVSTVKSFLALFSGGTGTTVAEEITATSTALESLATAFTGVVLGYAGFQIVKNPIADAMAAAGVVSEETAEDMKKQFSTIGGVIEATGDVIGGVGNTLSGLPAVMSGAENASAAFGAAMDEIARGSIYTDEQLKKMQETWEFTEEDMESLRQEMLLTNPELRTVADSFGLFDASAETLKDVATGIQQISDGSISAAQAAEEFQKPMWGMTEEAKKFFNELGTGSIKLDEYQLSMLESAGYSQEFVNSLNNAFAGMEGFNENAAAAGLGAGLALSKGLEDSTASIGATIGALGIKIATEGAGVQKQASILGGSTIAGFNNGITQNMDSTDKPLNDWEDRIVKTIHDGALKFGSPSKTTYEYGEDTVIGYNNGIEKNVPKTIAVIKAYMQTVQNTFKELVTVLYEIGQDSMSALLKGLASKQSELKQTVKDMTELMGEAATASSGIKFSTGTSTASAVLTSASQLTTSSVMRGGNPYGATASAQSAGQTNGGILAAALKQAVKEGMKESGAEYTFTAKLNGKTIYTETVKQDQIMKKSTGKSGLGN